MPRNKKLPKQLTLKKRPKLTPEQEEILHSGLRILAHMIAEAHLKKIAPDPGYCDKLRERHNPDVVE